MRNIIAKLRSLPKRTTMFAAILAAVIAVPAALYAWGPERPTFTIERPADHITFNSITNNPNIGDERNFVGIRENGTNGKWQDNQTVEAGKSYVVRMYVHNNAASNLNLVAKDVTAKFNLPTTTATSIQVNGFLSSSNASPTEVYDHATFSSDKKFNLALVPGTIKYYNNANGNGFTIPESLFTSAGAKLGYTKMDGNIPGCFQYAGYLTFIVKPQFAGTPNFEIDKQVRVGNSGDYSDSVTTKAGNEVEFKIKYKNTGDVTQDPVTINDKLPKGLTYVAGTSYISNQATGNQWKKLTSDNIVNNGINIGGYVPGGAAYLKFTAKVTDESALECGKNTLINTAYATTNNGVKNDTATVIVNKDCKKPVYSCDLLTVEKITRTSYKFAVKYTAQDGATYKGTTYKVYDQSGKEVYSSANATFDGFETGTYTVKAFVTVSVDGTDKTVTSEACAKQVTIKEEQKPAIKIEKLVDGVDHKNVDVNQEFTYQIKVTNTGNVDLKDAVVTDKQPTGVTFISASEGTIADGTWTTTIPTLKIGESKSYTIKAKVPVYLAGSIKNTVCVDTPTVPGSPDDCDDATIEVPPSPEKEKVCNLDSKTIIVINKGDFDGSKHSRNLSDCDDVPVTPPTPETPPELPHTGITDGIASVVGLGSLIAATSYYNSSRRALRK